MNFAKTLSAPTPLAELLARGAITLMLDFDGTLVPIASGPDAIVVDPGLPSSLEGLSRQLSGRLALVSGRSLEDLAKHIGNPAIFMAGSHGAACCSPDGAILGQPPMAIPIAVTQALAEFAREEDLHFEPKTHGAALHFRSRPELAKHAVDFAKGVAAQHNLQIKQGKSVVELVQPGGGKGGAVCVLMAHPQFAGAMPVFIGDDVTDEDGFIAASNFGGFGIAVGERPSINANYHLQTVQDVHEWLKL
jgi:trehalose 6-phosphate phosphatase